MDFLFQLLYNAINFLTQFGKYLLSLYCSTYTTCTVTDNHKHTILEQNLSLPLIHLKQKGFKSNWNTKNTKPIWILSIHLRRRKTKLKVQNHPSYDNSFSPSEFYSKPKKPHTAIKLCWWTFLILNTELSTQAC